MFFFCCMIFICKLDLNDFFLCVSIVCFEFCLPFTNILFLSLLFHLYHFFSLVLINSRITTFIKQDQIIFLLSPNIIMFFFNSRFFLSLLLFALYHTLTLAYTYRLIAALHSTSNPRSRVFFSLRLFLFKGSKSFFSIFSVY